ncbi:hypothetical protein [Mammaliicoccus lentus]|uniref:hypothetical protein n=1 Tax=Mammaliicoccus lentus TaxID=42858 RepID=UPI001072EA63|nr:hypothetical protein [Mammaliicoccus lentus]MBF0795206.1 hypothetical protein [Mammaliicoccus lentus]TFV14604.1 hypothetical protein E4T78_11100 [Mammaliicoccus lentus]
MNVKDLTIQKMATNLINAMLRENVELGTADLTKNDKTVVINGKVYMDISTLDKGYYSTGVINGENYMIYDDTFDKVIELLKENQ